MHRTTYRASATLRDAVRQAPLTQMEMGTASDLAQSEISTIASGRRTFNDHVRAKVEQLAIVVGIEPARATVRIGGRS